jgi:hypothetical protein
MARLLDSNIEYAFLRKTDAINFLVELHWDIAWRWGKKSSLVDDLWGEAQRKNYWGANGYALSEEWNLLYLAVHAAHHQWQGLKWLVDIHQMSSRSEIDWERLIKKAERLGLKRVLALTLSTCHELFDTAVPQDLLITPLPKWMKIFPEMSNMTNVWANNFFPARLFERRSAKIAYLSRIVFLPTLNEQRLLNVPSSLEFLYFPLRPVRLLCKWITEVLRRLFLASTPTSAGSASGA